jgi:hypothetical protein
MEYCKIRKLFYNGNRQASVFSDLAYPTIAAIVNAKAFLSNLTSVMFTPLAGLPDCLAC